MERWRIHLTPLGAHPDAETRLYDPGARHGAIRRDEEWEVEFSADSLRDLAAARVAYEMVRLTLPPELIEGTVGDVVIRNPGGNVWMGKLQDFLRALNTTFTGFLKGLVDRVEELERMGTATPEDAIGVIAMTMKLPQQEQPTKAAD